MLCVPFATIHAVATQLTMGQEGERRDGQVAAFYLYNMVVCCVCLRSLWGETNIYMYVYIKKNTLFMFEIVIYIPVRCYLQWNDESHHP